MSFTRFSRNLAATVALATAAITAQAGPFSDLVIFGDSLSDTGNLQRISSGAFPDLTSGPYFSGRYSNGLIWTDYFGAALGLSPDASPFLAGTGGMNYAVAGARTGNGVVSVPNLIYQERAWWAPTHASADPNALYVVVAGGNDMRDARSAFTTNSAGDQAGRQAAAATAGANIELVIKDLADKGAKHILVSNLPDLGHSPEAVFLGLQAASTDATNRFNGLVTGAVGYGQSLGVAMSFLDMAGVADKIYDDAVNHAGATYGLTNAFAPCNGFFGSPNIAATACNISLFSDALHPSSAAHALIAGAALQAIPEPETYALMAMGLAALAWRSRRAQRVAV